MSRFDFDASTVSADTKAPLLTFSFETLAFVLKHNSSFFLIHTISGWKWEMIISLKNKSA